MLTNSLRCGIDRNVLYVYEQAVVARGNLICWPPMYHVTRIFDDVTRRVVTPT